MLLAEVQVFSKGIKLHVQKTLAGVNQSVVYVFIATEPFCKAKNSTHLHSNKPQAIAEHLM